MNSQFNVTILGATGAVGHEFLRLFEARQFPVGQLNLLASTRSAGKTLRFRSDDVIVNDVESFDFSTTDVAFFSAGGSSSNRFAPAALQAGALVIDNSSAFRMRDDVPLIVPEVNAHAMTERDRLIANPNCTAAILLMAMAPLRKFGQIDRVIVSTYQSASGAGAAAMQELEFQTSEVLAGREAIPKILPHPYAFNLFSHNTPINAEGFNDEEAKVVQECRKMLELPNLRMNVTCVRVPILRAHSESVTVEFQGEAPSVEAVRELLENSVGVRVIDDRENNHFPMPIEAACQDDVLVGRIRRDPSHPSAISMFICGDQLLKGAALNAVQIAEHAIQKGWVKSRAAV